MDVGRSVPRTVLAVARIAGHVLTGPALRRRRTTWGATPDEVAATWPGDELLSRPSWTAVHAVTVQAPPERVWPWLAQLGQGRGGFYSFERLENLAGCRIHNTDRVLPEHQHLAAGDRVDLFPGSGLPVARVEPGRDLVLGGPPDGGRGIGGVWSFHLRPGPDGSTRLVERLAMTSGPAWKERLSISAALLEPLSFVMSQEMLRNIRRLAEDRRPTEGGTAMTGRRAARTRCGRTSRCGRTPGRGKRTRRWSDLTPGQQTALLVLGSVELSLALTAWTDLARRPAEQVNGSKAKWAAVIALNIVGPLVYFRRGIRR